MATKFWNRPDVVTKTPLVTTALLEAANGGQLYRMWTEHTAAGQSLAAWSCVFIALTLWWNFYRVCCPDQKFARWATVSGMCMNMSVILTVVYWRFIAIH